MEEDTQHQPLGSTHMCTHEHIPTHIHSLIHMQTLLDLLRLDFSSTLKMIVMSSAVNHQVYF